MDLGEFSRILLLHGVYQEVARVKEYFDRPLATWVPSAQRILSKFDAQEEAPTNSSPQGRITFTSWRNAALDCVDVLHWAANGTIAQLAGAEHPTVLHLHFSRVVLLAPHDKILTLARSIAPSYKGASGITSPTREEAIHVEREIVHWAQRDEVIRHTRYTYLTNLQVTLIILQHKARLAALHCGCFFWHIRRYSRKAFYEPLSVLLTTLTLWAYSSYASRAPPPNQHQQGRHHCEEPGGDPPDDSDASRSGSVTRSHSPVTSTTTANPGPTTSSPHQRQHHPSGAAVAAAETSPIDYLEPTFIRIDRPCDDELVQLFVRSGRPSTMRAYVTGVGDICGPQGPARMLREGRKVLVAVSTAWGRTQEYVALLEEVERATTEKSARGREGWG